MSIVKRMHSQRVAIQFAVRLSEKGRKHFTQQSRYDKDHHARLGMVDRENSDLTQWRVTWEGCKSGQWYDKRFLERVEPGTARTARVEGFYWIRLYNDSRWGIGRWNGESWNPIIVDIAGRWVGSNPENAVKLLDTYIHEIGGLLPSPMLSRCRLDV